jgi:hypothetical protein
MKYIDRVQNGEKMKLPRSENSSKQIPKGCREDVEELEGNSSTTFLPRFWSDLSVFRMDLRGGRERTREEEASTVRRTKERERVKRKGEEKGEWRWQSKLPKTGSTGLKIGSTGFAAARPEKCQQEKG